MVGRIASAMGLLVALVGGFLAVAELSTLQDRGETLTGAVGTLYESISPLVLILLALGAIAMVGGMFTWLRG